MDKENIISPTQYSILAETEEEVDKDVGDELEDGEVFQKNHIVSDNRGFSEKQDDHGTRPSLPRASKSSHKVFSDSSALNAKEKVLGATSKKGQKKKS